MARVHTVCDNTLEVVIKVQVDAPFIITGNSEQNKQAAEQAAKLLKARISEAFHSVSERFDVTLEEKKDGC